jgi:hypothetical protein
MLIPEGACMKTKTSRLALRPAQPPIQWVTGIPSAHGKVRKGQRLESHSQLEQSLQENPQV